MANELVAVLNKFNRVGITNLVFDIFALNGDFIATTPATEVLDGGAGTATYRGDMPAGNPAGCYLLRLQRPNDRAVGYGEVYWDGVSATTVSDLTHTSLSAPRFTSIDTALAGLDTDVAANATALSGLATGQVNLSTQIAGIAVPSAAAIATAVEAAILDEGDASAVIEAMATAIEATFADDTDSTAFLALVRTQVLNALGTYGAATGTNVSDAETAIIAAIPTPSDATLAQQNAILAAVTAGNSGQGTAANQTAISNAIATLAASAATAANQATQLTALNALSTANASQSTALSQIIAAQTAAADQCEIDRVVTEDLLTHFAKGTATVVAQWSITKTPGTDPRFPTLTYTKVV